MTKGMKTGLACVLCSVLALGAGIAIGGKKDQDPPRPAVSAEAQGGGRRVRMTPELARHAGVRAQRATRRALSPTIELLGSVDFDADRVADVGGRISGRVTRIFVRPGDEVRAGAPLAEIESSALGEAIATYLSARARLSAAQVNARREAELGQQQLSTARAVEQARAEAGALQAEVRGAEQRLLAMGATPGDIRSMSASTRVRHVTLRAPIAGRVVSRTAVLGQTVEATSNVLRIADLSRLWVQLDVFERDIASLRVGDPAALTSESYPGRTFEGHVNYVDATIDTRTRTARVRIEVANPDLLLRPGQFVTARVRAGGGRPRDVISVPRRALVQLEGRPALFVALGDNQYEARIVELGVVEGDFVEVTRGIDADNEVVVDGAFALKSELLR